MKQLKKQKTKKNITAPLIQMKKDVQIIKKKIMINRLVVILFGSQNTIFPTIPKMNKNKGRNENIETECAA